MQKQYLINNTIKFEECDGDIRVYGRPGRTAEEYERMSDCDYKTGLKSAAKFLNQEPMAACCTLDNGRVITRA